MVRLYVEKPLIKHLVSRLAWMYHIPDWAIDKRNRSGNRVVLLVTIERTV